MRALLASGTIVDLPGVSLVPCIPNESREDRKQVGSIEAVVLESNGFFTWIIHAVDDEGWEGV